DPHRTAARLTIGLARDAHQPAHRLDDIVIAGTLGIRTILAKPGYGRDDQAFGLGPQARRIEPELAKATYLEVLDHDVARLGELAHEAGAFGPRKINGCRFLAAVGAQEVGSDAPVALPVPGRAPVACVVTRPRALDLDHL